MDDADQIRAQLSQPVPTQDERLSVQLAKAISGRDSGETARRTRTQAARAIADRNFAMRAGLVESKESDPHGFERILGESDLLSINFLDRGRRAADAVCRIKLPMDGGLAYGSGLLVGPRLLLTNNHVLASPREAAQAEAEFGYEHDLDGVLKNPVQFNLDPDDLFFTSSEVDFTLVALAPLAENGVPLDRFGWLPLIPLSGKTVDGEWVTIIQHPQGGAKQIAIHASQIVKLDPKKVDVDLARFIHYSTDTEPGSSGSPVFNDQWQVVALHHKAVPSPKPIRKGEPEWLANEGVRVSAIFNLLERNRFEDDNARRALDRLERGLGFPPLIDSRSIPADPIVEKQFGAFKPSRWAGPGFGYDPDFLSETIPLEAIYAKLLAKGLVAPLLDGSGAELQYLHYSSIMHALRRFPIMTAVNIDGLKLQAIVRKDSWRPDDRMDRKYQSDDIFYVSSDKQPLEKVYFSRGHMVRLLDPCWSGAGDDAGRKAEATRAMEDTFHFTNAAPQVQKYNDQDWGNLEDYVLDRAQMTERRMTVFTGPIYRDNDPLYGRERKTGPWQIPLSFWKIAVLQKTPTTIAAAAFINGQTDYVQALYEAKVFSGLKPYTLDQLRSRKIQTTVAAVEEVTGLDFGDLKKVDAHGSLESTRQTRWFNRPEDIII
jgi:endonuclease G, mitochondrial